MDISAENIHGNGGSLGEERELLAELGQSLIDLSTADHNQMSRGDMADLITELVAATERATVVAGRFAAFGNAKACSLTRGSRSVQGLLNSSCRISRRRARQLDLMGSAEARYPWFHRALIAGGITLAHIEALHPVWKQVNRDHFHAAERTLAQLAALCTPEEFADYLAEWRNCADEDEHLDEFLKAQASQHLVYGFDLFGGAHIAGTVGPLNAEPFIETLLNKAKDYKDEAFTPTQASMAALVDLVLNPDGKYRAHLEILHPEDGSPGPTTPPAAVTDEPEDEGNPGRFVAEQVPTTVRAERACTNLNRRPIDRGFSGRSYSRTARGTLIPRAVVERLETEGARVRHHMVRTNGTLASDAPSGRRFSTVQTTMIRLRDNRCQHTGCRIPHRWCDYDHVTPWHNGGPSLIANGQLLCGFHHRWKHRNDPAPGRIRSEAFTDSPLFPRLE